MKTRDARCSCGCLSVVCEGEPTLVALCHCRDCQRRTGSAFGVVAFFDRDRVRISGEASTYARPADSGYPVTFHFCPTCGSSVYWYPSRKPDKIGVAVGAFADRDFPAPAKRAYPDHRHPWVQVSD